MTGGPEKKYFFVLFDDKTLKNTGEKKLLPLWQFACLQIMDLAREN